MASTTGLRSARGRKSLCLSVVFGLLLHGSFWFTGQLNGSSLSEVSALPTRSALRLLQREDEVVERQGVLPSPPELSDDEESGVEANITSAPDSNQEQLQSEATHEAEAFKTSGSNSNPERPESEATNEAHPSPSGEQPPVGQEHTADEYNGGNGILPLSPTNERENEDPEEETEKEASETEDGPAPKEDTNDEDTEHTEPADDGAEEPEEEEEIDHHHEEGQDFDFQYYLPQQYRKVIPGTNIDYYDYVLLEERRAHGEIDELPNERSGSLPSEEDAGEKPLPVANFTNGVYSYCYATETADILERCSAAATLGIGVYIPMVNMTDFGRHDDDEIGNPAIQDVSLPAKHYSTSRRQFPPEWFEAISELKNRTRLMVGGLWFGPPDFDQMDAVLQKNPNVFDGILVDWDSGVGACMTKVRDAVVKWLDWP